MKKSTNAFTIVELLIVIVVIAILAAISIVTYTGVQQRARLAAAEAEARSLYQAAELFRVEQGRYPRVLRTPSADTLDLEQLLHQAGLYEATRGSGDSRILFCGDPDSNLFALVAFHVSPAAQGAVTGGNNVGQSFYYTVGHGLREGEISVTDSSIGGAMCVSIDSSMTGWRWAHDVPLSGTG